jgi:TRAP-type C4-dicarboxylate transport system substrate-binding protein
MAGASAKQFNWKFSSYTHPGNKIQGVVQKWWCSELEKRSNGQIKTKMYWANELCGPREMMGAVKSGLADVVGHSPSYTPGKTAIWNVTRLPFICAPRLDQNAVITIRMHRESKYFLEDAKRFNCVFAGLATAPPLDFMGKKAIRTCEDLKGVRIRCDLHTGMVLKEFGAVPIHIPAIEIYTSMDKGMLDLVNICYPIGHLLKLDEISKYLTLNVETADLPAMFFINRDSYNALPDNLKKVIQDMVDELPAFLWDIPNSPKFKNAAWGKIKETGIEVIQFPKSERQRLMDKAASVWEKWAKDAGDYEAAKATLADYERIRDEVIAKYPEGVPGIKYK